MRVINLAGGYHLVGCQAGKKDLAATWENQLAVYPGLDPVLPGIWVEHTHYNPGLEQLDLFKSAALPDWGPISIDRQFSSDLGYSPSWLN